MTVNAIQVHTAVPTAHADSSPARSDIPEAPQSTGVWATAQAKEGVALLHALRDLTASGHHGSKYSEASDELFSNVSDPDGDDYIFDIFQQRTVGPVTESKSAWAKNLSVEHSWPRSKGAREIAEADLHHLFVADKKANEMRGNYPYGEIVRDEMWRTPAGPETSMLGVDKRGERVFEPAPSARGNIARGLLYFATRYSEEDGWKVRFDNFERELPLLMQWHKQDPVDDAERARNDLVAAYQGNRNPYIDHPEFVEQVGMAGFASMYGNRR